MTQPEERTYAFNRRTVDDQTVYVRATSLAQARAKALAGNCLDTSDCRTKSTTFRRLPNEDIDA